MSKQRQDLREALAQILSCGMDADSEVRRLAEERKKALEMTEDYPFLLLEIIDSTEEAVDEKTMASIFLKNYLYDFYRRNLSDQVLQNCESLMPRLTSHVITLMIKNQTMREMLCKALTYIAYTGYWGLIDNKIMAMLQSDDENILGPAVVFMRHLFDFDYGIHVSSEYFEILLNVFTNTGNPYIKGEASFALIFVVFHCFPDYHVVMDACRRLGLSIMDMLKQPYSPSNNFHAKRAIIKSLCILSAVDQQDQRISYWVIRETLPAIGNIMIYCCQEYKHVIMESPHMPRDQDEDPKEPKNFIELVIKLLELVNKILCDNSCCRMLQDELDDLLTCLFTFICAPDTCSVFMTCQDQPSSYKVRNMAVSALNNILRYLKGGPVFFKHLQTVYVRHLTECTSQRLSSPLYYGKMMESLMYGLGKIRSYFPESYIFLADVFPHRYYLETWNSLLNETNFTIVGRIVWLCGKYSASLSKEALETQLRTNIRFIHSLTEPLFNPVADAIMYHLQYYVHSPGENRMVINNLSPDIAACLFKMAQIKSIKPQCYLNALGNLYKLNIMVMRHFLPITLDVLSIATKSMNDNKIMNEIKFLLGEVSKHECNSARVLNEFRQFLMQMIYKNPSKRIYNKSEMHAKAFELLNNILINNPQPVSDSIVQESFYPACDVILNLPDVDNDTVEAAVDLIITMLIKMPSQIKRLTTEKGEYLADFVPKIIYDLLDPAKTVWTERNGKLVVTSIITLTEKMDPHLESILKSVLSCALAKNVSRAVEPPAWLTFAYIFMYKPADTVNFLSSIPGPTGGSALAFLIAKWNPDYIYMVDGIEKIIVVMAIIQIIAFAMEETNDRFKDVIVHQRLGRPCTGVEYLYMILIHTVLEIETNENARPKIPYDDHRLFKAVLPFIDVDLGAHIKNFLKNQTQPFFNAVTQFFTDKISNLQDMGLLTGNSME